MDILQDWIFVVFAIFSSIIVVYLKIKEPEILGVIGEKTFAKRYLSKLGPEYRLLNNLLFKIDERTTQIDHVVVSPYGIFVLEMKNYKGLVRGEQYSKTWLQYPHRGRKYYPFPNSLRQNYGHAQVIAKLLPWVPREKIISIVVFPRETKLFVDMKGTSTQYVLRTVEVGEMICSFSDVVFSSEKVDEIVKVLNENNIQSNANMKAHVKRVKQKESNNKGV